MLEALVRGRTATRGVKPDRAHRGRNCVICFQEPRAVDAHLHNSLFSLETLFPYSVRVEVNDQNEKCHQPCYLMLELQ